MVLLAYFLSAFKVCLMANCCGTVIHGRAVGGNLNLAMVAKEGVCACMHVRVCGVMTRLQTHYS